MANGECVAIISILLCAAIRNHNARFDVRFDFGAKADEEEHLRLLTAYSTNDMQCVWQE